MRLLSITAYVFLIAVKAFGITAAEHLEIEMRAQSEGWVYGAEHPDYATGYKKSRRHPFSYESLTDIDVDVPEELDYRPQSSSIRDQKSCGSCWAFSITAMLRDVLMIKGLGDPQALSEQYLVDCASDMYGCNGGMPSAAKWITVPYGSPSEAEYPYTARNGRCKSGTTIKGQALEWHYVGQEGRKPTSDEIMKALVLYGPLSVTVAADNAFAGYRSGVFHGNSRQTNHMIDINGYSKKGGYFIVRNSWNTGWGMNGWGYMAYGANSLGAETILVKVKEAPPVPVIREFGMDGKNLEIKVTLKPKNKKKVDDAKKIVQPFMNDLEKR